MDLNSVLGSLGLGSEKQNENESEKDSKGNNNNLIWLIAIGVAFLFMRRGQGFAGINLGSLFNGMMGMSPNYNGQFQEDQMDLYNDGQRSKHEKVKPLRTNNKKRYSYID